VASRGHFAGKHNSLVTCLGERMAKLPSIGTHIEEIPEENWKNNNGKF